jgi:hypothetical protein
MRLISVDSYSYGDKAFAWSGLLDPKLFQRYTYLLPELIVPSPVTIPILSTSFGRVGADVSSPSRDVLSVASSNVDVTVRQKKDLLSIIASVHGVQAGKKSVSVSI